MHVQIINFRLKELTDEQWSRAAEELAPAFAAVPGLLSKVWLADRASGTYGGVYLWRDRAAYEAFTRSDLFRAVGAHPNLTDITSHDFEVIEGPTRITRGQLAGVAV